MFKKTGNNHKIEITDLVNNSVTNALMRRYENLTYEEAQQIQGGIFFPIICFTLYSGGEDGQVIRIGYSA